ncbi:hypothetical protein RSOLAG1IB_11423 [Rhizoctonia solani AG-1 IB]|uniref:Zn(2)-C6 fungal-type domain-containing protein n=1 Tax=Thanatephorus cucumeris (strain AG1-IB / isolate 7/3/14) TaxID=1108050 RepID=A0A0B7F5Y4_THACB|nr:hypothetical protein RSOLAG1IB_11423 [Rhizoctonia solani AG-1 IB]
MSLHDATTIDVALAPRPLHRGSGCHECRRRKLKCSGTKPACDRCVRSSTACVYDPVEKSKVALLRDEVVMLRQKVKHLEAMISTAPKSTSPPLSASVPAKRPSPSDDSPPRPHPPPRPQKRSITLSSEDQIKLLNQFSQVQHVAYEYTNVPPNPHPAGEPYAAKTSAFLLASHFSANANLRSLSPDLLECTRDCIDEAIRTADFSSHSLALSRPLPSAALVLDAIHASSLLASWLLVQGRCVECQQTLFSAAKLAILSGIHKIRSLDSTGRTPSPISPNRPPSSHSDQRSPISDERHKPSGPDGRLSPSHLQRFGPSTVQVQRSITPVAQQQNLESIGQARIKTMISPPVGIADTKNRVGIFWQLLSLDYTAAILMGSSVNVSLPWEDCPSEVRVETIWPDLDSSESTCTSIASLFHASRKASPTPSLAPTGSIRAGSPSPPVDPHALRAKSIVLLERAVRLSAQSERGSRPSSPRSPAQASPARAVIGDATRAAIKETDAAISNVLEQLPTARSVSGLHPHTLLLCARVRLHETLASQDHVSQVVWVQSAVAIVRLLDGMCMDDVVRGADLLLAYAWMASYMVLLHERYYVPYHPESEHVARIKSDLDKLHVLLDIVGERMPVIATLFKTSVAQFHALRDRKSSSPFASPPPTDNGQVKTEDEQDELEDDD